jgi:DNA polymerase (family 10)
MTNDELAQKLKDLRDFLIIAGYEESHATRYTQIARFIEKLPEPVTQLRTEGRLSEIPGVGKLVAGYIEEIIDTGTTRKIDEWLPMAPLSVLELVRIPGLGAKTARKLWQEHGIGSLETLKEAERSGILADVGGIGPKMLEAVRNA